MGNESFTVNVPHTYRTGWGVLFTPIWDDDDCVSDVDSDVADRTDTSEPAVTTGHGGDLELNYYGNPINLESHVGDHAAIVPTAGGLPPVCTCGWTPHHVYTMADHLRDMNSGSA